jgi:uncharacterized protein YndB with AHSA1/START domain
MSPAKSSDTETTDYTNIVRVNAGCERVFHAIASCEGLQRWWTPLVSGSADSGGDLRFEFDGLDEFIVMHVDEAVTPSSVRWTCAKNTGHPEWIGSRPTFTIIGAGENQCVLDFCHVGLQPDLSCYRQCERGWDHYLASIAAYAESGQGTPFGT